MITLLLTSPSPAPMPEDGSPAKLVLMVVVGVLGGLLIAGLARRS